MKRLAQLAVLLAGGLVLADVIQAQADRRIGPISILSCRSDGGLLCWRDAGSVGELQCNSASSTETGCVTPSAQSWAGDKTFSGNVKTPIIDAGIGAIGSLDLRGSTITGTATTSTLTIQSNTAAATTSSTVPAIKFKLGANLGGDVGWSFEDSAGNARLSCTDTGTVNFATHVTSAGASAGSGGTQFSSTLGAGADGSGATAGAQGGLFNFTAGRGGTGTTLAGGGNGGAVLVTAGQGGAASSGGAAGTGGALAFAAGPGGSSGTSAGGAGGAVSISAGTGSRGSSGGGAASFTAGGGQAASTTITSSAGGTVAVSGGSGGAANATQADPGSAGGAITVQSGQGGAGAAGPIAPGAGGALTLKSGGGGSAAAGLGAASGNLVLDTGAATGAATNGTLTIGATSAESITMGRTGKLITAPGSLTVTGSVIATAALSTTGNFSVGASGTSMSDSRVCTFTVNPGLIAAQTCANVTSGTCSGASTGDPVACAPPAALEDGLVPTCFISAAGTGKVRLCNVTAGGITPASATYGLRFFH